MTSIFFATRPSNFRNATQWPVGSGAAELTDVFSVLLTSLWTFPTTVCQPSFRIGST
jgi:hypothetical protein